MSFGVVACSLPGCTVGGLLSRRVGERRVALVALCASAGMCLLSPLVIGWPPLAIVAFMFAWGLVIATDSPQFSALAARYCPPEYTGTALTIQNGVGFLLTVGSIQLVAALGDEIGWRWVFVVLAPGPLFGAWSMLRLRRVAPD